MTDTICCCRRNPVNHGVGKPCLAPIYIQLRRLRKLLNGLAQGVAIAHAIVTAQDRNRSMSSGKAMGDEADEAAQGRAGELGGNHGVLQIKLPILI